MSMSDISYRNGGLSQAGDRVRCVDPGSQRGLVRGQEYIVKTPARGTLDTLTTEEGYRGFPCRFEKLITPRLLKAGDTVRLIRPIHGGPRGSDVGKTFTVGRDQRSPSASVEIIDPASGLTCSGGGWGADRFEFVAPTQVAPTRPAATAGPAKVDLKSLKKGDTVTLPVTFTVISAADSDGDVEVEAASDLPNSYLWGSTSYIGSVERAPLPPFKVGDLVLTKSHIKGVIKAIDGDNAWIALDFGNNTVRPLAELTRR